MLNTSSARAVHEVSGWCLHNILSLLGIGRKLQWGIRALLDGPAERERDAATRRLLVGDRRIRRLGHPVDAWRDGRRQQHHREERCICLDWCVNQRRVLSNSIRRAVGAHVLLNSSGTAAYGVLAATTKATVGLAWCGRSRGIMSQVASQRAPCIQGSHAGCFTQLHGLCTLQQLALAQVRCQFVPRSLSAP